MIIVNGSHPLIIITKHSILDVAAALDPPLASEHFDCQTNGSFQKCKKEFFQSFLFIFEQNRQKKETKNFTTAWAVL